MTLFINVNFHRLTQYSKLYNAIRVYLINLQDFMLDNQI